MTVLPISSVRTTLSDRSRSMKSSASGPRPYRVVLVGDGSVLNEALSTEVARSLAERTGHGVDVEVLPAAPLADAAAGALLPGRDLERIDAVAVLIDPDRWRRSVAATAEGVGLLLEQLRGRLVAGSSVVVVVPPAMAAGLDPRRVDEIAEALETAVDSLTPVVRLEDAPEDAASAWGAAVAAATASGLIDPMVGFLPDDHYDEDLRLDAVDLLPPRDGLWVARFQQFVDEARERYGTSSAALSIIDADHARYGVTAGFPNKVIKRGQTLCNRTIRTYGGVIVGDASQDLRFEGYPDVRSGDIRFWAGYRIESEDGAPLGSLCVFDAEPRDVDDADLVVLRDLAIALQRSLWELQRASAA
ncbi:GAF domain-containing protein [Amnibacterium setariae]|uniref:GAF domain-containing protein n=2 Tax=Amnibacterium setariae TaxID=2306585 RepID=A0A3A1U1X8_9MICO|nr:GAF domain-containing protein [Amnibacterium setariae]